MCAGRVRFLLFGFLIAGLGWVVAFIFGQVSILHCSRPEPSQVVCVKEVKFLSLVPIREETVRDVRQAWLDESCDSDGCTYRVMLVGAEGDVPLTTYYSSGWQSKEELVSQINAYVGGSGPETLEIREGVGILAALFGGIFMIIGAVIALKGRWK